MGSMSSRAGTVTSRGGSFARCLSGITGVSIFATLPNLPPQPIDHQIQISGKIRLARASGQRVRAQHK